MSLASLGITRSDAELLRSAALVAAAKADATPGLANEYRQPYNVDFDQTHNGRTWNMEQLDHTRWRGLPKPLHLLCNMSLKTAMKEIETLSVVATLEDLPEKGLVRGQVGTVVETWAPGTYEVEFCDELGRTYAFASLKSDQLMPLHYTTIHQAA